MLFENIEVTAGVLNNAVVDRQQISNRNQESDDGHSKPYHPKTIRISNVTGNTVHIAVLTEQEYTNYITGGNTITDFLPIANNSSENFSDFNHGKITDILVSGVATHSASLDIYVMND